MRGWWSFLAILDLRWVMASKFDFGMMYGVEIMPSRELVRTCLALPCFKDAAMTDCLELYNSSH
jgi:hypothetical protein